MKDSSGSSRKKRYSKYTKPLSDEGTLFGQGGASGHGTDECRLVDHVTQLQRVQASISTVTAGQILKIQKVILELRVIDDTGLLIGYLSTAINNKLLTCIEKGFSYNAVVISISGKVCRVKVQPT